MFPDDVWITRPVGKWRTRLLLRDGLMVSVLIGRPIQRKQVISWRIDPAQPCLTKQKQIEQLGRSLRTEGPERAPQWASRQCQSVDLAFGACRRLPLAEHVFHFTQEVRRKERLFQDVCSVLDRFTQFGKLVSKVRYKQKLRLGASLTYSL
jgi:hypothetical protein